jgi:hypothetical protein
MTGPGKKDEQPLTLPTNRVFAVIDDPGEVDRAVAELEAALSPGAVRALCCDAGARRLDARGSRGGPFHRAIRVVQQISVEGEHAQKYQTEAQSGHYVLEIEVPEPAQRDTVLQILRSHGAHFINVYGRWTIESVRP